MSYAIGPFDIPHLLMAWGGKLPGGETWSCSLRLAEQTHVGGTGYVPDEAYIASWVAGSLKDAVQDYHTRPTTGINPLAKLSFVKLNAVDVNGRYTSQAGGHEYVFADLAGGGDAVSFNANQIAIAVSLTTGFTRGPAHRGRYYLPMPAMQNLPTGLINPIYQAGLTASTKTFLEAVADVPGADILNSPTPSVMSRKAGAAGHRKITGCAVGQVLDTQRRRRRSLPENYSSQALDLGTF